EGGVVVAGSKGERWRARRQQLQPKPKRAKKATKSKKPTKPEPPPAPLDPKEWLAEAFKQTEIPRGFGARTKWAEDIAKQMRQALEDKKITQAYEARRIYNLS